jgi:hypothetical protein
MPVRIAPSTTAVWVPARPGTTRDEALGYGIAWFEEQCAAAGVRGLLVCNDKWTVNVHPRLLDLARRNRLATPRVLADATWTVPVLAYHPDVFALHLAVQRSHGASLCVVEGSNDVGGWAAVVAPTALGGERYRTPGPTGAARTEWLRTVDLLAAQDDARRADAEATTGLLSRLDDQQRRMLPSAMVARGASPALVRRVLRALALYAQPTAP